jgi:hypothetical protein
VRNRFPLPTFLKQLDDDLQEQDKFLLKTVQNLYESIPKTAAVLEAKGDPTPYEY